MLNATNSFYETCHFIVEIDSKTWTFNINTSNHVFFPQSGITDNILYKSIMVVVPNCTRTVSQNLGVTILLVKQTAVVLAA